MRDRLRIRPETELVLVEIDVVPTDDFGERAYASVTASIKTNTTSNMAPDSFFNFEWKPLWNTSLNDIILLQRTCLLGYVSIA